MYTVVDLGPNIAAQYMIEQPRYFQLFSSVQFRQRSHGPFVTTNLNKTSSTNILCLLGEIEMALDFTQHSIREITHFHLFGTPPRILSQGPKISFQQQIDLQELLRTEMDHILTSKLFKRAFNPYHGYDMTLQTFTTNQLVWFHRRNLGWRKGMVQSFETPMVIVSMGNRIYQTHETRVRPYLEQYAIPRKLLSNDNDESTFPEYEVTFPNAPTSQEQTAETQQINPSSVHPTTPASIFLNTPLSSSIPQTSYLQDTNQVSLPSQNNYIIEIHDLKHLKLYSSHYQPHTGTIYSGYVTLHNDITVIEDTSTDDFFLTTV